MELTSTPFNWGDGTVIAWTKWGNNQPVIKSCIQMKTNGEWERKNCDDDKHVVCGEGTFNCIECLNN